VVIETTGGIGSEGVEFIRKMRAAISSDPGAAQSKYDIGIYYAIAAAVQRGNFAMVHRSLRLVAAE
jgi:hypothetical protein